MSEPEVGGPSSTSGVGPPTMPPPSPPGWTSPPTAVPPPAYAVAPVRPYPSVITDQRQPDTAVVVIAWIAAVLTALYMLPWAIAATRGKSNQGEIGLLNFFLGWTVIGWVVTLVMACQRHRLVNAVPVPTTVVVAGGPHYGITAPYQTSPAPGWYPAPDGWGRQYWDGYGWTGHRAP